MDKQIDKVEYASLLYDFYGALLSDAQRDVMSLYHEDNLSLSEIAEELGQSRQAVHYTLKKAEAALAECEDKLSLIKTYEKNQKIALKATKIIDKSKMDASDAEKLKSLISNLAE